MSPAEKSKLKRSVAKLGLLNSTTDPLPYACAIILVYTVHYIAVGGKLENSWSPSCTHLVMSALTVTVKVCTCVCTGGSVCVCMCV